jgi:regulatory protein
MKEKKEKLTPQQALLKLAHFCSYQERCHEEVKSKLAEIGVFFDDAEWVIYELIQQNYLNEERFAQAYAGGKFRIKKWGKNKIRLALKQKKVSDYCIQQGLKEIDSEDYARTLQELATNKYHDLSDKNPLVKANKTVLYLLSKGYENDLAWDAVNRLK